MRRRGKRGRASERSSFPPPARTEADPDTSGCKTETSRRATADKDLRFREGDQHRSANNLSKRVSSTLVLAVCRKRQIFLHRPFLLEVEQSSWSRQSAPGELLLCLATGRREEGGGRQAAPPPINNSKHGPISQSTGPTLRHRSMEGCTQRKEGRRRKTRREEEAEEEGGGGVLKPHMGA